MFSLFEFLKNNSLTYKKTDLNQFGYIFYGLANKIILNTQNFFFVCFLEFKNLF